jgi:hypothetical protein
MLNEMTFIVRQLLPIYEILGEINFFCSPKRSLMLLEGLPEVIVLNGVDDVATGIFRQDWLDELCH